MSFGALSHFTRPEPHPAMRRRIVGVPAHRLRSPVYLGMSPRGRPTYLIFPNDPSFLVKILLWGPSGSGKSITMRNIVEGMYIEWRTSGERWRHPIIIFDWKANYLGIHRMNKRPRDRYLLREIHSDFYSHVTRLKVPRHFLNVYAPAYLAPAHKKEQLRTLRKRWGVDGFWGIPWRRILDLAHLGTVLKVPAETMWAQELQPWFDRAAIDSKMTFKELVRKEGYLEKAADRIGNPITRGAAYNFIRRWRQNKHWFRDDDFLARHLFDPFSVSVLTFVASAERQYQNQLAFLVALESTLETLQNSKIEAQPVIVIHDILNLIGEGKPFRNEIVDALNRMLAGQARSLTHGYIIIVETQNLKAMPEAMRDPKSYTIALKFKWKSQEPLLRNVAGFLGGVADVHDNFNNFHRRSVVVRPPVTGYQT